MKKGFLIIFALFFIFAGFTACVTSSSNAKNDSNDNINAKDSDKAEATVVIQGPRLTPQQAKEISTTAALVLRKVAQARLDIHIMNYGTAVVELQQALLMLEVIKASLPTTEIRHYVSIAKKHLSFMEEEDVIPDLIPIEASLDEINDIINVNEAKKHLNKAKEHLKQGNKQKAASNLQAIESTLIYSEVSMPLASTEFNIVNALKSLLKKDPKKADAALEAIEDNVHFFAVGLTGLENIAHGSLWKASKDYAEGNIKGALKNLKRAEDSVTKLISGTQNIKIKESANKLLEKIKKLEKDINK